MEMSCLSREQIEEYRRLHRRAHNACDGWYYSSHVDVFMNRKSLEKELSDLEQASLATYRAMVTLKKFIALSPGLPTKQVNEDIDLSED